MPSGYFQNQWLIRVELIKSYLPNQDKDYFLNRLNYLTLAPLGNLDKFYKEETMLQGLKISSMKLEEYDPFLLTLASYTI